MSELFVIDRRRPPWPLKKVRQYLLANSIPEPNSGCRLWTDAVDKDGYGLIQGKWCSKAHRLAWEVNHGPIPDGLHVLHKCDVPSCIEDAHLFLGTHLHNVRDMDAKGRRGDASRRGEENANARLTAQDVAKIREAVRSGAKAGDVGRAMGVSAGYVSKICRYEAWAT